MSDTPDEPTPEETVHLERVLPGPIERVWENLTNPEHLAEWLEADGGIVTHSEPPQRLSWSGDRADVTLELEPRGEEVLLKVTHRRATTACGLAIAA
jgi:uncharacterized protein YndB with AHSA1/START domain